MRLADIQAHTITRTIDILGEDVKIVLRPSAHTTEWESRLQASTNAGTLAELLAEVLVEIDITEPTGPGGAEELIPCDGATLARVLPADVFIGLFEQIGVELRPGKATESS